MAVSESKLPQKKQRKKVFNFDMFFFSVPLRNKIVFPYVFRRFSQYTWNHVNDIVFAAQ